MKTTSSKFRIFIASFFVIAALYLGSNKLNAQAEIGDGCSTYCPTYNFNLDCVITYSDGKATTCYNKQPWWY